MSYSSSLLILKMWEEKLQTINKLNTKVYLENPQINGKDYDDNRSKFIIIIQQLWS